MYLDYIYYNSLIINQVYRVNIWHHQLAFIKYSFGYENLAHKEVRCTFKYILTKLQNVYIFIENVSKKERDVSTFFTTFDFRKYWYCFFLNLILYYPPQNNYPTTE